MNIVNTHICSCCFQNFENTEELLSPMKFHTQSKSHYCPICYKIHARSKPYERNTCPKMNQNKKANQSCNNQANYIHVEDINFDNLKSKEKKILMEMCIQANVEL